jgi:hypothetical protein
MAIDPSKFHPINVADTCSVWNILSSPRLNAAAKEARCDFCVTSFVQYECLIKPRKSILQSEQTLMDRLRAEQRRGVFQAHSCGIEDLQAIELLEMRKKLGKGELSSIAFAMKIRQGFITDDRKAWQLAKDSGHPHAQTTPHLFSWLIFTGRLGDCDKDIVIAQHVDAGRHIARHLETAYEIALQCRLNSTVSP